MTTDPLGTWKARIERAQSEAQGLKGIFKTTLQDRAPANATFFEHDGQEVSIVGLVIERSSGSELFDEEALPFFKGGFADGAELLLFGVLSRNRRKFRQPINVACPSPGRWGRPNSRVTSRHFDHGNASRMSRPDCSGLDGAD